MRGPPKVAGASILDAQAVLNRTRALKAEFDRAHADGMKALKAHDSDALADAIARETAIIDEEIALIARTLKSQRARSRP